MLLCCCRKKKSLTSLLEEMQIAIFKHNIEKVKKILNNNNYPIDMVVDFTDKSTALLYAIKQDQVEIIQILIQHGADLEKQNYQGQTGLHIAVLYESINTLNYLLSNNLYSIDIKNKEGQNVFQLIKKRQINSSDMLKILKQYKNT